MPASRDAAYPSCSSSCSSSWTMRLLAVLGALAIQCAATKSWSSDSYPEESFSVFGWLGYLKRFSVIALMLSGVVLYYIPESRPHARKLCYALIDLTANGLKSALSARESEYIYEKIKSKYQRARYQQSLAAQNRVSQELEEDHQNFGCLQRSYTKRSRNFADDNDTLGSKEKRKSGKSTKDLRQSRHRLRSNFVKDYSPDPCMEIAKPAYLYSDKLDDLHKYLKTNVSGTKRGDGPALENYTLLISGSPQEMVMFDQKYEKDDVVIVQDPYIRLEYKECGTSTDKLSSKADASSSELEGPTRDHDDRISNIAVEPYLKEIELSSIPEGNVSNYLANKSLYQASEYQCGGECCGSNGCSMSSANLRNRAAGTSKSTADVKNVLKSSRSLMTPKLYKKNEERNHAGDRLVKSISPNTRRVDFRKEDINDRVETHAQQRYEENARQYENAAKVHRRKVRNYCCNDVSYFTDREAEADDEISQHGERAARKHDLDEKPQREDRLFRRSSNDLSYDYAYDDVYMENELKPTLLRAVNWLFGGCPAATRRASKRGEVGKEESQGLTDEWLL